MVSQNTTNRLINNVFMLIKRITQHADTSPRHNVIMTQNHRTQERIIQLQLPIGAKNIGGRTINLLWRNSKLHSKACLCNPMRGHVWPLINTRYVWCLYIRICTSYGIHSRTRRSENDNTPQPLDQWTNSPFMGQLVGNWSICHALWAKRKPIVHPTLYLTHISFIPIQSTFPFLKYGY